MIKFEWDLSKSKANLLKHGISFEEAKTVFYDENARVIKDPGTFRSEQRYIVLGLSTQLRLLIVCHCYRENDEVIRIISARKATHKEAQFYGEY